MTVKLTCPATFFALEYVFSASLIAGDGFLLAVMEASAPMRYGVGCGSVISCE